MEYFDLERRICELECALGELSVTLAEVTEQIQKLNNLLYDFDNDEDDEEDLFTDILGLDEELDEDDDEDYLPRHGKN